MIKIHIPASNAFGAYNSDEPTKQIAIYFTVGCLMEKKGEDEPEEFDERAGYISSVNKAKLEAVGKSRKKLNRIFQDTDILQRYDFTDKIDDLGQEAGESHIAIVHIDGNEMGQRFQATTSLEEIRKLAHNVECATENAFKTLIKKIDQEFPNIQGELNIRKNRKTGKPFLPLRPIILSGDDITFVSEGRFGIYCAELFMNAFEAQKSSDGKALNLTACAGIAITKTKFPFYRGYELSEKLCKAAKQRRHDEKLEGNKKSWLDFHIAHGGFSGSLEEIRERHYKTAWGTLLLRPYLLNSLDQEFGFKALIDHAKQLQETFPRSKIYELRTVLTQSKDAALRFVAEQKQRGNMLPCEYYREELFQSSRTPYFDMIEFLEYYPDFALRANKEGRK